MVKARGDHGTLDLLSWQAPTVVASVEAVTRGGDLASKTARAVAHALRTCGRSRDEIAAAMSAELNQKISAAMLDAYASEAKASHRITVDRFVALIRATQCIDLAGFVAEQFGLIAVPASFGPVIELHLVEERERELATLKAGVLARMRGVR